MRVLSMTAGAAGMYCGSCLRDNALAAELLRRGHDVILLPLYTPTRTDEPNVSADRVFFGGINVYLQQRSALFRRTPWMLDRVWDSRLAFRLALRRSISVNPSDLGELTMSVLKGERGNQRKEFHKLIRWIAREEPPDVIVLPNSLLISLAKPLKEACGRPVCCTLQGEDLFLGGLSASYRQAALEQIRSQQRYVDVFLAVSEYYADFMTDYVRIPREKIRLLPIGITLDGHSSERRAPRDPAKPYAVGYFARVAPEKGLHVLCEAYRLLRDRNVLQHARLEVGGYLAPEHRSYLTDLAARMASWGLGQEFQYRGTVDRVEKIRFLQQLDVFSVPGTYPEPKGIFVLEALANGVPAVQPRHGVFPEMHRHTGGLLLVDPGGPQSLADAIAALVRDPARAIELGRRGAEGVRQHYDVRRMADRALEIFESTREARESRFVPAG